MVINGIDKIDNKIVDILLKDGRISYSDIAIKVGLTRTAVKNRISALEEKGIIEGYKAVINPHNAPEMMTFVVNVETSADCFEKAKEFYQAVEEQVPNLVILDIMLPDESGYDILKKIRRNQVLRKLPVIMVTAKTQEIDMIKGLDEGADDYIRKPFSVMELISRVKALLRRTEKEEDKVLQLDEIRIDHDRHEVSVDDEKIELTFKEYELLRLLVMNKGVVMTRENIMIHVWGTDFEGESRTVDMHIKTLRQKLGNAGSRIRTVRNVGYVIE